MTNKELVNQISGLNSTSTLKNWIQLIKEISGKEFKKIKVPISRNPRTHQLVIQLPMILQTKTLDNFKKLAKLKLEIGLKEAIQAVFGSLADNEHESLNQVIDELYDELSALKQEFKREMRLIKIENSNLKKKIQDIEESMQTGLLGFVNKRSKKIGSANSEFSAEP